jgi:hypothetical protein
VNERGIIGVVENHNQVIVGNEYKKGVKLSESRLFYASNL